MTHNERNQVIATHERLDPPTKFEGSITCGKCGGTDFEILCGRAYCQNNECEHFFDIGEDND